MNMRERQPDAREGRGDRTAAKDTEGRKPTVTMPEIYDQTFKDILEGEIVRGKVIEIGAESVMIDIGYKSEGSVPAKEFLNPQGQLTVHVGDVVDVYLESKEDSEGLVVLSREKAEKIKVWDEISKVHEKGGVVQGTIVGKTKGGLIVDIGVRAFLPGSQVDLRPVRDLDRVIGKTFPMKIIKLNQRRGNIVLSRRELLEEERKGLKEKTLATLVEGKVLRGKVKNITEYGAFIDLGGLDGLLHITDMSWGRIGHPSELFAVGGEVEVVVLKFDRQTERVSLGYKQRLPDPWESVTQKFPPATKVKGKVVSITDYGAFVELDDGIDGLIHVSDISWTKRVKHPSDILKKGDRVEAIVLHVDKAARRISLGLKQTHPDPWKTIVPERYRVGMDVTGKVVRITDFGAFVELPAGIGGLLHVSELAEGRVNRPEDVIKVGEELTLKIIKLDPDDRKLGLSLRAYQEAAREQGGGE